MALPKSVGRLKQEATALKKKSGLTHAQALEEVAKLYGFPNWKAVLLESVGGNKVDENKAYLVSYGLDYSVFVPTETGLMKSILDATHQVRHLFKEEGFHDFESQKQGPPFKVIKDAYFVFGDRNEKTQISLYRPETKDGDPRMWFKGLGNFASPNEQVAIVVYQDAAYLINLSRFDTNNLDAVPNLQDFIQTVSNNQNEIADELLIKLREIAKEPIKSIIVGDTAVGMAVEAALKIPPNSCKKPDYKGIELKSGRGGKNRSNLFGQVADWENSPLKSSLEILQKYGYFTEEGEHKLYCTISAIKPNSQGLYFVYNESLDQLQEQHEKDDLVVIWSGEVLRERLLEKHAETFWIQAKSIFINGIEYFDLQSVTHTKKPVSTQLLPLIQSGVVTMDHLIKRKGKSAAEKGPLFKINKKDLSLLFPEPKHYSLK